MTRDIQARQFGMHSLAPWRWTLLAGTDGAVRALVQDGAPETNVYAVGEVLTHQARLIAELGPSVLVDFTEAQERALDVAETLDYLTDVLEGLLRRAYRHRHREHYSDLGVLTRGVTAMLVSLNSSALDSKRLLDALELAVIRSRVGATTDRSSLQEREVGQASGEREGEK